MEMTPSDRTSTIISVAKEAGVSIATVSRVINNPSLVAQETRHRVMRVIQERNFRISKEAQMTRRRHRTLRTGRVGFLVPDYPYRSSESITEEMLKGIQKTLKNRGLELVMDHYPYETDPIEAMPKMLRENSVDGVLVRPPPNRGLLVEFCRGRKAVVLGNTFADLDVPCVITDDWAGMRLLMNYLFELGHRRIAFLSASLISMLNLRRFQSYRSALEERQIKYDERLAKIHDYWIIHADESETLSRKWLAELMTLEDPPTAITCATDGIAAAMMLAASERGMRVPRDISITGFGDQYYAAFTDPPLTTVHIDQRATGEIGAQQLLQLIEGANYSAQTLVLPTFVERRSCAAIQGT
jgi:LacI family transcriptional regulator